MQTFNQNGESTVTPIGIGLDLSEIPSKYKEYMKEGTEFEVVIFDIDHYEKCHCKVTKVMKEIGKTYYQIISKQKHIPKWLAKVN